MAINAISSSSTFFVIGKAWDPVSESYEQHELGFAIDHENGRLTNERLVAMSDEELKSFAYSKRGVCSEMFHFPNDQAWCQRRKDGTLPGQLYEGVHRAVSILRFREAIQTELKLDEKKNEDILEAYRELTGQIQDPDKKAYAEKVLADWALVREKIIIPREKREEEIPMCEKHKCFAIDCEDHHQVADTSVFEL